MRISAEEAWEIMQKTEEEYVILDVRSDKEYFNGHIEGAIPIPVEELSERIEEEIPYDDMLIFVYSNEGISSGIADELLSEMGYTNVKDFGGILDWSYGVV